MSNLIRYIKNKAGEKEECVVTTVNITKAQHEFLKSRNLNQSLIFRDVIEDMMRNEAAEFRKIK